MPSRHHVTVKVPFDHYDRAGIPAVLSAAGMERFRASKKAHFVEHQAEQLDNGCLVVNGKALSLDESNALITPDGNLVPDWKEKAGKPLPKADRQAAGPASARA